MKAFIWKEWREKRVWAIPLLASTVGVVALRQGYMFSGGFSTFTPLAWLSILYSVDLLTPRKGELRSLLCLLRCSTVLSHHLLARR